MQFGIQEVNNVHYHFSNIQTSGAKWNISTIVDTQMLAVI